MEKLLNYAARLRSADQGALCSPTARYLLSGATCTLTPSSRMLSCISSGEALRTRLIARGYPRDEWKLANWETFWSGAQANSCNWSGARHLEFDNSAAAADVTVFAAALAADEARSLPAPGQGVG